MIIFFDDIQRKLWGMNQLSALYTAAMLLPLFFPPSLSAAQNSCTTKECHAGIADIVPAQLPMMKLIKQTGIRYGDMDGCVVCHGGNPKARDKEAAHKGIPPGLKRSPGPKDFYPNPGAIWIAQNTCGVCHAGYVYRVRRSLMNTEAGKIQGNLNTWGAAQGYEVVWGNHEMDDPDGPIPSGGSLDYETYMARLRQLFPKQFPDRLKQLPTPSIQEIESDPSLAAFVYQRRECQRCHLGIKGREVRGDFRGSGCSACHMPYGPEALYQGKDKSISKEKSGHILRHQIRGNRKTKGIPVETCTACHNRGKRIGVSFTGLMESPFSGPFDSQGKRQSLNHGRTYTPVREDHHHSTKSRKGNPKGGLLCQDCHTSMDIHGNGNLQATTLAQVEIECTDCHGTPDAFPWELPLGHGDEFGQKSIEKTSRGVSSSRLMSDQQFGYDYDALDGYLLSARGNPLGNVVKTGSQVVLHSATGKDFFVPVLKGLGPEETTRRGEISMRGIPRHMERMECYTCHSAWTPQCYGCHVKVDLSRRDKKGVDWVRFSNETRHAYEKGTPPPRPAELEGDIQEENGYMRWETPVIGVNGEGRISPLMPGCQVVYTILGADGKVIVQNHMPKNPIEAKAADQSHIPLALDMAPVQPHTANAKARSCESCHTRPKTLGLGIGNGEFKTMKTLDFDWSQILSSQGVQLATVGTHWPASRALNKEELERMLRTGTCMGCHQFQKDPKIWGRFSSIEIKNPADHTRLMKEMIQKTGAGISSE